MECRKETQESGAHGRIPARHPSRAPRHDVAVKGVLPVRGAGVSAAVEPYDAARRRTEAANGLQDRRLVRAVGTEQSEGLAASDVERHIEQHLDVPIGEVDVVHLQHRYVLRGRRLAVALLRFLAQLLHDQREIAPDERRAPDRHQAADQRRRNAHHQSRDPRPATRGS